METTRRGFLKLLGIGGAAAVVGGPSLFSGGADLLVGTADHFVFDPSAGKGGGPLLLPQARAHFLFKDGFEEGISRLLLRNTRPWKGQPWCPTGDCSTYQVDCPVRAGEDPHVEFFMAADNLRRKINDDVQEFSRELQRYSLVMVTVVDVPIMAFPKSETGFYLETQIQQFAVEASDIVNRGDAVSFHGDVPIEAPNDIDFKYLMHMQEELRAMGLLTWDHHKIARRDAQEAAKRVGAKRVGFSKLIA